MKNRFLSTFILTILSISITSAKLINPSIEGDEEVKVLVLKKNKNYKVVSTDNPTGANQTDNAPRIIKIGDKCNIKEENGKSIEGFLGKITDEGIIVIIDKQGLTVGETELSKITQVEHKGNKYTIDAGRYTMKIKTRIITAKSKRKKKTLRNILGKTLWTILGIVGITLSFRFFL